MDQIGADAVSAKCLLPRVIEGSGNKEMRAFNTTHRAQNLTMSGAQLQPDNDKERTRGGQAEAGQLSSLAQSACLP